MKVKVMKKYQADSKAYESDNTKFIEENRI